MKWFKKKNELSLTMLLKRVHDLSLISVYYRPYPRRSASSQSYMLDLLHAIASLNGHKKIAGALSSVMQVKTGRLKAPDHDGRPRGHIARSVHAEHFTLMATAQKTFECPICVEKCAEGDLARLEGCEHQFCRECLKGHIESCLEERKFPVPCPLCMTDEKREDKYCGGMWPF